MCSYPNYISRNPKNKDKITQAPSSNTIEAYKKWRRWTPLIRIQLHVAADLAMDKEVRFRIG